jgi:hypothetical protein
MKAAIVSAAGLALATALLPAGSFAAAPASGKLSGCEVTDKECLFQALKAHPAKSASFWKPFLARPVEQRLGPAPPGLVELLTLDNRLNGFPENPRPSRLADDFVADVRGAMADLPPAVRRAFDAAFAGVWFVDELGGTGFTDVVLDGEGRPAGGFIVLDAAVLGKFTANAWATWKENTPFKPAEGWTLEARIEEKARDDRRGAIRYILLHELGHVLSINRDVHPSWNLRPREVPAAARFPFFELSWTIDAKENRYDSRFDRDFPLRRSVVYYLGAKLAGADMVPAYDALQKTNFPTLYAATSPGDDFAESFVSYVHTVLLKRPWEVTLRKDGRVVKSYGTCWEEPRCAAKRRILEALLR